MLKLYKSKNDNLQYEFLPSALEIAETPPSVLGMAIVWIISLIIFSAIVWACFGEIDEVAVARGKIVPDGRLKVIQPLEEGIVTAIHVNEGQRVKAGQLLIELDSTMKRVEVQTIENALNTARLEKDILNKVLAGGNIEELAADSSLPDEIRTNLLKLNKSKDSEYATKRDTLNLIIEQNKEQLNIGKSDLEKLEKNVTFLKEREQNLRKLKEAGPVEEANLQKLKKALEIIKSEEKNYKDLYDQGAISKKEWEDKYNELALAQLEYETQKVRRDQEKSSLELSWKTAYDELVLAQKELETQKIRVNQAASKVEESGKNLEDMQKGRTTDLLTLIVDCDKKITTLEAELTKAEKSMQYQSLTSPVNGTVHGIAASTIGGVVTPAQPIMTIVPEGTPLIIEASILNKDIGFVTTEQEVVVKFDTFPFQKYGTIKGKTVTISPDAFEDEKLGSVYKTKISLEKDKIRVEGKDVDISPGMAVNSEIKIGKRKIIEYFLSPIIKYTEESFKLR